MKKRLLNINSIIAMLLMLFMILSSCAKDDDRKDNDVINNNIKKDSDFINENDTDKIQLWYYTYTRDSFYFDSFYMDSILKIVDSAKKFCDKNNIILEIYEYDEKRLSFEDYIVKRNLAAASGNMIIIENINYMHELSKQHDDYSKIDNYKNLLSGYKDRFCIPLGVLFSAGYIDNAVMQYYGINHEKKIITFNEYLEVKQRMKENGARFELNYGEFTCLIDYYQNINGLTFINDQSEILADNELFKKMIKKTIVDICNDFLLYYDEDLDSINTSEYKRHIYDKNSGLTLYEKSNNINFIFNPDSYKMVEDISNKTFYIEPFIQNSSVNFYMYKKVTNNKIYDLANHIVSEETYLNINKDPIYKDYMVYYTPIFNVDKAKESLGVNDNLEFIKEYEGDPEVKKIISDAYEVFVKNDETSKEIADYHFMNYNYQNSIKFFINDLLKEISYELSGDKLSLKNFDPKDETINKMIDKKVNDFVLNFKIHNN